VLIRANRDRRPAYLQKSIGACRPIRRNVRSGSRPVVGPLRRKVRKWVRTRSFRVIGFDPSAHSRSSVSRRGYCVSLGKFLGRLLFVSDPGCFGHAPMQHCNIDDGTNP
jgi:hypothetical protein